MVQDESQPRQPPDIGAIERAVGLLMGQRSYSDEEARRLLFGLVQRQGRSMTEVARDILAGTQSPRASPVRLSAAYLEIGAAIGAVPGDIAVRRVTEMAVARITGASWASVTLRQGDSLTTVAATHPSALAADQMQYELREGPCYTAVSAGNSSVANELGIDERWPVFGARAEVELAVEAMLAVRLGLDVDALDDTVASLNVYGLRERAFTDDDVVTGTLIAAHASTAVIASQYRHRLDSLRTALATNREIGVAMGILMHQHKVTRDGAFGLLRVASQHANRPLRDIAADVVETGALPLPTDVQGR